MKAQGIRLLTLRQPAIAAMAFVGLSTRVSTGRAQPASGDGLRPIKDVEVHLRLPEGGLPKDDSRPPPRERGSYFVSVAQAAEP